MALIKCSKCGQSISDTSTTCIHCGAPVKPAKLCPECKNPVSPQATVCPSCGYSLTAQPTTTQQIEEQKTPTSTTANEDFVSTTINEWKEKSKSFQFVNKGLIITGILALAFFAFVLFIFFIVSKDNPFRALRMVDTFSILMALAILVSVELPGLLGFCVVFSFKNYLSTKNNLEKGFLKRFITSFPEYVQPTTAKNRVDKNVIPLACALIEKQSSKVLYFINITLSITNCIIFFLLFKTFVKQLLYHSLLFGTMPVLELGWTFIQNNFALIIIIILFDIIAVVCEPLCKHPNLKKK